MTQQYSRRNVLGSVAGATALAGCPKIVANESTVGFQRVTVEGDQLVIELDSADSNVGITVIDPRGETFTETQIGVGATRETVHLGTTYLPGKYEVRAILDDETTAKTTLEIRPELEIVEIGIGANHSERMPDSLGHTYTSECFVTIRNTGTGPTAITQLGFSGDVPGPTDLTKDESGIFDHESEGGQLKEVPIHAGGEVTIFSATLPFSFEGDGVDCRSSALDGVFDVSIQDSNDSNLTIAYEVHYPASESYDGCTPEIGDRI